jgi:hypothetical protein
VQILAQDLHILLSTTYPKSSSRSLQKHRSSYFTFQFFKQKQKLKSIYMLWGSCSFSQTEYNKVGFAIFGFFCELIWNLQVTGSNNKIGKNLLALSPWDFWTFTSMPSHLTRRPLGKTPLHNSTLPRRSKLAGGEVGPGDANTQGGRSIRFTRDWFAAAAWAERGPAMTGGEAVIV